MALSRFLSHLCYSSDIQGGYQPATVSAGIAVDEDRFFDILEDSNKFGELGWR
jgi:hypothetical protein